VYDAYASHRAYPRLRYIIVTDIDIDFSHLVIVFSHLYSLLLCHVSARDRNLFICEILIHFSIPAKHGDGSIRTYGRWRCERSGLMSEKSTATILAHIHIQVTTLAILRSSNRGGVLEHELLHSKLGSAIESSWIWNGVPLHAENSS
jgi:hypothetical protein